jgi:hypothetical protein
MALDGEASLITSGFQGAVGFVDLYYLMARSTWVSDRAQLERLLPEGSAFWSRLARLIWPVM